MSAATGISINDLRLYSALQRYAENRNDYGSRYIEYLKGMLGPQFVSSDARLQNPEYLGGGRVQLSFSEVLNTSNTDTGDYAGHGIGAVKSNQYVRFFEEHGFVFSLLSVVPKPIYTTGTHRS